MSEKPWVGQLIHARGLCDDWGTIRDETGKTILTVNCGHIPAKDLCQHRREETDPTQATVDFILRALVRPCILAGCPVGGTVLDPFGGSGTTGQVALELGRRAILIELNPEYVALAKERTNVTPGLALA